MATYYVGSGGSDTNAGTSYSARFLTLSKAATTVSAGGDIVKVAPGTYRETLTASVSGGNAYSTGTITLTNGSTTVTGSGTTFTGGNVVAGYYLKTPTGGSKLISAVNTATELILTDAWDGPTGAGLAYLTYNPIKWEADYSGAYTDGVGGVVRITGSADDITGTRAECITSTSKSYNHFTGFALDLSTTSAIDITSCTYFMFEKIHFQFCANTVSPVLVDGAGQLACTFKNCHFGPGCGAAVATITFSHSSLLDNVGHVVENCILNNNGRNSNGGVYWTRVGGCLVKNCTVAGPTLPFWNTVTLTSGQVNTVNNCIICGGETVFQGTTLGNLVEDYNAISANVGTLRSNVSVGANSINYPALFDTRWFWETVA